MATPRPFDLRAYLIYKFPSLLLDGGLLHRWPLGVRFELGIERFRERASKLYEAVFSAQDTCVLISQDWPANKSSPTAASRYFPLFSLPGAFKRVRLPAVQHSSTPTPRMAIPFCNGYNFLLGASPMRQYLRESQTMTTPEPHQFPQGSIF